MGYSGAAFNTEKVLVEFASKEGSIAVCEDGRGLDFDEDLAKKILSQDEVEINCLLYTSGVAVCSFRIFCNYLTWFCNTRCVCQSQIPVSYTHLRDKRHIL